MGDIREINHTYRIDPRTQQSISIPKRASREQPRKEEREQSHDEIKLTHRTEEENSAEEASDSKLAEHPEEIPGLDISV